MYAQSVCSIPVGSFSRVTLFKLNKITREIKEREGIGLVQLVSKVHIKNKLKLKNAKSPNRRSREKIIN